MKNKKSKGAGTYQNELGKYECPKCKEKFRLKMALDTHKCKNKIKMGKEKNMQKLTQKQIENIRSQETRNTIYLIIAMAGLLLGLFLLNKMFS